MWTLNFWKSLFERGISTAAQSALLYVGAEQLNVLEFDWAGLGGFALGGFVLAVLKGLTVNTLTGDGAGVGHAEVVNREPDTTPPDPDYEPRH